MSNLNDHHLTEASGQQHHLAHLHVTFTMQSQDPSLLYSHSHFDP